MYNKEMFENQIIIYVLHRLCIETASLKKTKTMSLSTLDCWFFAFLISIGSFFFFRRSTPTPQQCSQQQPSPPHHQSSSQPPSTKSPSPPTVVDQPELQPLQQQDDTLPSAPSPKPPERIPPVQRTVSLPASPPERCRTNTPPAGQHRIEYSQSERLPNRPQLSRSTSKKEAIKKYIRKETANFFGVNEDNEDVQQMRWLDRRKRMCAR